MDELEKLFPHNLYHSYIIESDPHLMSPRLRTFFEARGDIENNSLDVRFELYDSFSVENSIAIKDWHSERSVNGNKKFCIIGTKFINHDAEQTLLKIIEEPQFDTHFFLVVPNADILSKTLKSRVHLVRIKSKADNNIKIMAEGMIKSNVKSRIVIVESIIKEHKDDENSGDLRFHATGLVNELEKIVYDKWKSDSSAILASNLVELSKARDYLSLPGASVKMILEHLSLIL